MFKGLIFVEGLTAKMMLKYANRIVSFRVEHLLWDNYEKDGGKGESFLRNRKLHIRTKYIGRVERDRGEVFSSLRMKYFISAFSFFFCTSKEQKCGSTVG